MSSTGNISHVKMTPTTTMGEEQRQSDSAMSESGHASKTKTAVGIVIGVHERFPNQVLLAGPDNEQLANKQYVVLSHSPDEIAEKWGTVRLGFKVRATWQDPSGGNAFGVVVGDENTTLADAPVENVVAQGLYACFAPGCGIG